MAGAHDTATLEVGAQMGSYLSWRETIEEPAKPSSGQMAAVKPASGPIKISKIDEQLAALLGTTAKDLLINDLAVNPASGNAYLSVSRGKGPDAAPVIVRVDRSGKPAVLSLDNIPFAKAAIRNPTEGKQRQDILGPAFFDVGKQRIDESLLDLEGPAGPFQPPCRPNLRPLPADRRVWGLRGLRHHPRTCLCARRTALRDRRRRPDRAADAGDEHRGLRPHHRQSSCRTGLRSCNAQAQGRHIAEDAGQPAGT